MSDAAKRDSQSWSGEVFGKYLLLQRIAMGGMAEVFLARPAVLEANGRMLVIKRILPHIAGSPTFVKMFQTEIQICMGFDHPNTVQVHDFGQVGRQPYIAVEYIQGKNLRQLNDKCAANGHKVPVALATSLIAQAAAGLHYAHTFENKATGKKLAVIHRDVTPHNLIVSYGGNLKIIDFGIAKAAIENMDQTQTGAIKGKAGYISPEQTEGLLADSRSDIFSLGIIFWELLTGRRLFVAEGENEMTILARIKNCHMHVQPPSKLNSLVPPELDEIVMKILARDPQARYQTAAELQRVLRDFLMQTNHGYSFSDVGTTISTLFEKEMNAEQKHVQMINENAQEFLSELGPELGLINSTAQPGGQASDSNETTILSDPTGGMWIRMIQKIKKDNRRATFRDYVLLAIYIVTLIGLKVDQDFSLITSLLSSEPNTKEVRMAAKEPSKTGRMNAAIKRNRHSKLQPKIQVKPQAKMQAKVQSARSSRHPKR